MRDQESINRKISSRLKGRRVHNHGFKQGYDPNRRILGPSDHRKAIEVRSEKRKVLYEMLSWDDLPFDEKRRRILKEQDDKCAWCLLDNWRGMKLVLELDHSDGIKKNQSRENLRFLCPNCHSQTPTWRRKKSSV